MSHNDGDREHAYGQRIERLRETELTDTGTSLLLDAVACPPVPRSVLDAVHADLCSGPRLSNPHSESPSGRRTRERIDDVRALACRQLFNVDRRGGPIKADGTEDGWEMVFTSGATASIQTVARSFTFGQHGRLAYLDQSHSSLYGIRDIVGAERRRRDPGTVGVDVVGGEAVILHWLKKVSTLRGNSLLAFPLQCNATGERYHVLLRRLLDERRRLEQQAGRRNTFILLDAASYLSPSSAMHLDPSMGDCQPDFICFSFLKILGYPSGLGGLLVARSSADALSGKQYYGGGALEASTSRTPWRKPARELHEALEDGTLNLYGIAAVGVALPTLRAPGMLGSLQEASAYVDSLTFQLWGAVRGLRHGNGDPLCEVYSKEPQRWAESGLPQLSQGPTLLFNVLQPQLDANKAAMSDRRVDPSEVDRLACLEDIHLRTGRMCNVGAITSALKLDESDIRALWERGIGCGGGTLVKRGECMSAADASLPPDADAAFEESRLLALVSGAIRVSLCAWNTTEDVDRLTAFLKKYFLVEAGAEIDDEDEFLSCSTGDEDASDTDEDSVSTRRTEGSSCGTSVVEQAVGSVNVELDTDAAFELKEVHIYPIKSCASQRIEQVWRVTEAGLEHDRRFCVIELDTGKVMSQKRVPAMARIRPTVDIVSGTVTIGFYNEDGGMLDSITVALGAIEEEDDTRDDPKRRYDMCGVSLEPIPLNDEAVRIAFSTFLGRPCTLARLPDGGRRSADGVPLRLSNESPFLLITTESIKEVCDWIRGEAESTRVPDIDIQRVGMAFRANFVVSGDGGYPSSPFYEDEAEQIRIGQHAFTVLGPCRRCEMVALDPISGARAPHVFSAVARHRRCRQGSMKGRILFGQHMVSRSIQVNLSPSSPCWFVKPGMPVLIKNRTHL